MGCAGTEPSHTAQRSEWIVMNIYGITDRGKVRSQNQDAFYEWSEGGAGLILVCDGMGGAKAGNVASALAGQAFVESLCQSQKEVRERLRDALEQANSAVYQRAREDEDCCGMGTTLVAAFAQSNHVCLINVGDSRGYYLACGEARQITRDHSYVEELVRAGRITREEAQNHPNRNIITRALGTAPDLIGDLFEEELRPGCRILLCSDGLSNQVTEQEMGAISQEEGSVVSCCARLVELALERGAPDNVTVAIMEYTAESA